MFQVPTEPAARVCQPGSTASAATQQQQRTLAVDHYQIPRGFARTKIARLPQRSCQLSKKEKSEQEPLPDEPTWNICKDAMHDVTVGSNLGTWLASWDSRPRRAPSGLLQSAFKHVAIKILPLTVCNQAGHEEEGKQEIQETQIYPNKLPQQEPQTDTAELPLASATQSCICTALFNVCWSKSREDWQRILSARSSVRIIPRRPSPFSSRVACRKDRNNNRYCSALAPNHTLNHGSDYALQQLLPAYIATALYLRVAASR